MIVTLLRYGNDVAAIREKVGEIQPGQGRQPGDRLYSVHIEHKAAVSVTREIVGHFNAYLRELKRADPDGPEDLQELERDHNIRLITTRANGSNAWVGCIPYRVAWYIAGPDETALQNFLSLLDGWLVFRRRVGTADGKRD